MFSNYDVFVLIIILMSSTLASYRGLVREIFSFISWIGAAVITFLFYPVVGEMMRDTLRSTVVISMIAIVVTYFSAFFLLSGISALLLDYAREVRGGPLDRSAGLLFGVFRGLLIVSLMHYCVVQVQGGPPTWLERSEFYNLSAKGSKMVGSVIDGYVDFSDEHFGLKDEADSVKKRTEEMDVNEGQGDLKQQLEDADAHIKKTMKKFTPDE